MVRTGDFGVPHRRGWHVFILGRSCPAAGSAFPSAPAAPDLIPSQFKLVLGGLLVVCCSAMLATARLPTSRTAAGGRCRRRPDRRPDGAVSGFSGLAPALWCTLRGYNKDEHRAVIQNFN